VGVVLLLVLVLGAACAGCWAVFFHRAAFSAVGRPRTHEAGPKAGSEDPAQRSERRSTAAIGLGVETQGWSTVDQLEAVPVETTVGSMAVLGWDSFVLLSVLFLDGTALLACRKVGSRRRRAATGFHEDDDTMLLRLGDDHLSAAVLAVFDDWRRRRAPLRLRGIGVPGAIEILDAAQTRIRAPLADA
jgi:hypothetical protein